MTVIFGIPNCDKCRAALNWFAAAGIGHRLHDIRADGLDATLVRHWLEVVGADQLVNRRSTTWRQISEDQRDLDDARHVVALILEHPTLVKRPVVAVGDSVVVGYDEGSWQALCA